MAKIQAMRVVKSLTKKGLIKKESRINKDNKGYTSNLYTLLNPKPKNKNNNDKNEVVSVRYQGGVPQIPGVVSPRYPNNTNIKNTSLNNVNRTRDVLENPGSEKNEEEFEDKENINDIKRKIKESLKGREKYGLVESIKSVVNKYPELKRYKLKENEQLTKEIAEFPEDDHSLGAFRTIAEKIPEQKIRIFLSIIKDTYLTGRIKKSRGAMFITLAKDYARKNNINLNFK
ncbi:MAG: hypothetical protein M1479_01745 [Actinobacteria bacterium]|nr:hypothetical protein [Actinomycetota bacterium]